MRTDIALDKLCEICPILGDISEKATTDTELKALLLTAKNSGKSAILKLIPKLKEKCETELYQILSIMFDKEIEEIKAQSIGVTIKQIIELVNDKDFQDFFSAFLGHTEPETASETLSTTSENIGA